MKDKVFAVTGAGSGIGRATAIRLAQLGASGLGISDVDLAGLEETRRLCASQSPDVRDSTANHWLTAA